MARGGNDDIDGARRAMRRLRRRPACMCAVCADHRDKVAGVLTSEKEMMTILLIHASPQGPKHGSSSDFSRRYS